MPFPSTGVLSILVPNGGDSCFDVDPDIRYDIETGLSAGFPVGDDGVLVLNLGTIYQGEEPQSVADLKDYGVPEVRIYLSQHPEELFWSLSVDIYLSIIRFYEVPLFYF